MTNERDLARTGIIRGIWTLISIPSDPAAIDRAGKRIFVSAAMARKLQVFSADSLKLLGEVPTGQRCWHFTFTPDDSKVLLACGRSNDVVVIDAISYKPIRTIEGFKLPCGIVTYPRSYGSLGLP